MGRKRSLTLPAYRHHRLPPVYPLLGKLHDQVAFLRGQPYHVIKRIWSYSLLASLE